MSIVIIDEEDSIREDEESLDLDLDQPDEWEDDTDIQDDPN
jgi:hypothetical protein